ncbi:MAG: HEAT repeat domain-containing protein [Planctomycetota bacterium]
MRPITVFLMLVLVVAGCSDGREPVNHRIPPSAELNPEAKAKLEVLKSKEDLLGIVRLWEAEGTDEDWKINQEMSQALVSFPREKFIPALVEGMKSKKASVSRYCLDTLLRFKNKRALDYFVKMLVPPALSEKQKSEALEIAKNPGNYEDAKERLIEMGSGVVEVLKPLLEDEDVEVASAAAKVIEHVKPHPVKSITVWYAFHNFGSKALPAFRVLAGDRNGADEATAVAIEVLGKCGTAEDAEIIRSHLKGEFVEKAIVALGNLKDGTSVPDLISLLKNREYSDMAARSLGRIGDKRAVKPLEEGLKRQSKLDAKMYYVMALARLGVKEHLNKILKESFDIDVVWYRIYSDGTVDEVEIVLKYLPKLRPASLVSFMCMWLGNTKSHSDQRVVKAIRSARKAAASEEKLFEMDVERFGAALIKLGDKEEERLVIARTKDRNWNTRLTAIETLVSVRSERFLPVLVEALDDTNDLCRGEAIRGVGLLADIPVLIWGFDKDRKVRELKNWYGEYREKKAETGNRESEGEEDNEQNDNESERG